MAAPAGAAPWQPEQGPPHPELRVSAAIFDLSYDFLEDTQPVDAVFRKAVRHVIMPGARRSLALVAGRVGLGADIATSVASFGGHVVSSHRVITVSIRSGGRDIELDLELLASGQWSPGTACVDGAAAFSTITVETPSHCDTWYAQRSVLNIWGLPKVSIENLPMAVPWAEVVFDFEVNLDAV